MPIWLRKLTFFEIQEFYKVEAKNIQTSQSGGKGQKNMIDPNAKINTPEFTAASKPYKGKTSYK